ncbi:MAG: YbaK/EbsC family protein [Phyllobacteriaceae bacterium]|nr:YbaK/EbsC family protein [Phyllobacteriaceae bacterium]
MELKPTNGGGSIARVGEAARAAGLAIVVKRMGESTRTAEEAATQCGVTVNRIVKSLVFQGASSGRLMLFLIPGDCQMDLAKAAIVAGETLKRADARMVRDETGFAIGGVSPLGHRIAIRTFADAALLEQPTVWAAAGAHDAVFEAEPKALVKAAGATIADLAAD